ncbi:MAG: hypothetical protein NTV33_09595 [Coprothermobacterota bacterium]|jgi:hypothetical protein|nr:hypothetical protein [Coprothermobacterota bacterium]
MLYVYGLVFLLFALLALIAPAAPGFRRWTAWLALILGFGLYIGVIQIQTPLQNKLYGLLATGEATWLILFASAILGGLLQEGVKMLVIWGGSFSLARRDLLSAGAFLGAGFVLGESFWILYSLSADIANFYPSLTFGQFLSDFSPLLIERAILILVNLSLAFLLAYGLLQRKTLIYFLAVFALHSVLSFTSLMRQSIGLTLTWTLIILGFLAILLYVYVISLSRRELAPNRQVIPFR